MSSRRCNCCVAPLSLSCWGLVSVACSQQKEKIPSTITTNELKWKFHAHVALFTDDTLFVFPWVHRISDCSLINHDQALMTDRDAGHHIVSFQGAEKPLCNINPPRIGPLVTTGVIFRLMCIHPFPDICLATNRALGMAVAGSTSASRKTDWFFQMRQGGRKHSRIFQCVFRHARFTTPSD